jgi:hypothetical protein
MGGKQATLHTGVHLCIYIYTHTCIYIFLYVLYAVYKQPEIPAHGFHASTRMFLQREGERERHTRQFFMFICPTNKHPSTTTHIMYVHMYIHTVCLLEVLLLILRLAQSLAELGNKCIDLRKVTLGSMHSSNILPHLCKSCLGLDGVPVTGSALVPRACTQLLCLNDFFTQAIVLLLRAFEPVCLYIYTYIYTYIYIYIFELVKCLLTQDGRSATWRI